MKPQLLLFTILMVLLPSCCSQKLAMINQGHLNHLIEIRDDARAEGYLAFRKGGKETFRFRSLLHEKTKPRIVEITLPANRFRSSQADLREVSQPYQPGSQPIYVLRVLQPNDAIPYYSGKKCQNSREWAIGKLSGNPRLFMAPKGRVYTDHSLRTELRMVRRSTGEAVLRNLAYVVTVPCDVVSFPVIVTSFYGMSFCRGLTENLHHSPPSPRQ